MGYRICIQVASLFFTGDLTLLEYIGIGGQREGSDKRVTQHDGERERRMEKRSGKMKFGRTKIRSGSSVPSFLQPRKKSKESTGSGNVNREGCREVLGLACGPAENDVF